RGSGPCKWPGSQTMSRAGAQINEGAVARKTAHERKRKERLPPTVGSVGGDPFGPGRPGGPIIFWDQLPRERVEKEVEYYNINNIININIINIIMIHHL